MPAHRSGPIDGLRRLLGAWRQRRAARRRAHLAEFVHLSDRMLADIGVRRADLHAAMSGLVPAAQIGRSRDARPWTAEIHRLRPTCGEAAEALPAKDLSAAA